MRRAEAILAAAMAISTAGCALSGKPKTAGATPPVPKPVAAAPAPPPLSTPQTRVWLPPQQPVDPDALPVSQPPRAAPQVTPRVPPAADDQRTRQPRAARPETPAQTTPPAQTVAPEPERPPIEEMVPPEQQKEFKDKADASKSQVRGLIDQAQKRGLSGPERDLVKRIETFVKLSDDAAGRGNMRQSFELADRALILARELQNGR